MNNGSSTQGGMRDWMRKVEVDLERLEDKWQRSVDDIKATIRAEISDLKSEQIAELRRRIEQGYIDLGDYQKRLRTAEDSLRDWKAGSGVIGYIVKMFIGVGGLIAGYLGGKHLP